MFAKCYVLELDGDIDAFHISIFERSLKQKSVHYHNRVIFGIDKELKMNYSSSEVTHDDSPVDDTFDRWLMCAHDDFMAVYFDRIRSVAI